MAALPDPVCHTTKKPPVLPGAFLLYTDDIMTKTVYVFPNIILVLLFILISASNCFAVEDGTIQVNIEEIKVDLGGNLILALFNAEGSWPKHDSALSRKVVPVSGPSMQINFDQISLDSTYAVQVLHDANRNDKLDFRWFPYPKPSEGTGVSNNNRRIGSPLFEKALFLTDGPETSIQIKLDY